MGKVIDQSILKAADSDSFGTQVVNPVPQPLMNSSVLYFRCAICLGEYQEKEVLRIMPKCGHSFHLSCIDVWLRKQSTCPVCRLSVQDSIQAKYVRQTDQVRTRASNNNSENNSVEHSQIWLLPSGERSEATGSVQTRSDSVAINLETSVPGEGAVR